MNGRGHTDRSIDICRDASRGRGTVTERGEEGREGRETDRFSATAAAAYVTDKLNLTDREIKALISGEEEYIGEYVTK